MNKIFVNNIGDLAEAQRASFFSLLCTGISEELIFSQSIYNENQSFR
jgi:hypothetical protein